MVDAAKAAHSAAWTIVTSLVSRGIGLVGTLVLANILAPEQFGQVTVATGMVLTADMALTFGVGTYLVAQPKHDRDLAFHATLIHVGSGLVASLCVIALSRPISLFNKSPSSWVFVPGLALATVIARVAFMPERILVRQMRFRRIGLARAAGEIAYPVAAVATAWAGAGGGAIVWASLARSTAVFLAEITSVPWRDWAQPCAVRPATLKLLLRYGTWSSLGSFADVVMRRWDNNVVIALFGTGVGGAYTYAYNLADVPSIQVGEQINDVLLSSLANMERERRAPALVRATGLLALIVFPLAIGLGAIAPVACRVVLKPEWIGKGIPIMLTVLSSMAVVRPLTGALQSYMQVHLRVTAVMIIEWVTALLLLGLLFTVGRLSPVWACIGVGFAFSARLFITLGVLRRLEGISPWPILARQWRPLLATVPMVAAVVELQRWCERHGYGTCSRTAAIPELIGAVLLGAIVYIAAALIVARGPAHDFLDLLRTLRRRTCKE